MTGGEDRSVKLWIGLVRKYLVAGDQAGLSEFVKKLDRVEVVELFTVMDLDERKVVFGCLDTRKAAFVLHNIDDVTRDDILESMPKEAIATERIDPRYIWRILLKQIRVGVLMGLVCGVIVGAIAFLVGGNRNLGMVVSIAMFGAIVVAASIGTITPIIFKRLNIDPAIAAGPFVTISNDITGLIIYFTLALWLLGAV